MDRYSAAPSEEESRAQQESLTVRARFADTMFPETQKTIYIYTVRSPGSSNGAKPRQHSGGAGGTGGRGRATHRGFPPSPVSVRVRLSGCVHSVRKP